jgi:type VI secretion system protein ImpM
VSGNIVAVSNAEAPGFYGKVPDLGDFVSRRLPMDFIQPWDSWLQDAITRSREQLDSEWLDVYLTSPIWRFVLSPGIAGSSAWAGVMMPSVDRVGRYFPFTIANKLDSGIDPFLLVRSGQAWFESAEQLALTMLDDPTPSLDELDVAAVALGSVLVEPATTKIEPKQHNIGWWLPDTEAIEFTELLDKYLPQLTINQYRTCSIWWSTGSQCVDRGIALCNGLPDSSGFSAMLGGNWQLSGWDDLSTTFSEI